MRRHNIFILGIILSSIYGINAVADWPTKPADDIWTNPEHTTPATLLCGDCCSIDCWLPSGGPYYDDTGRFTENCTDDPLSCPSGQYDIGFGSCVNPSTNGSATAYYAISGSTSTSYSSSNMSTYGLTTKGTWAVEFSYGTVKGEAMCSNTKGTANTTGSPSSTSGNYCWCRMTDPGVSSWVAYSSSTTSSCTNYCARYCATAMNDTEAFRVGAYESVTDGSPICRSDGGYYNNKGQCSFCDPASFKGYVQTENISHGKRSRTSTSCDVIDTNGGTSCGCSSYNYGSWTYSCDSDSGYYVSGNQCKYCAKYSFDTSESESSCSGCYTHSRSKTCTGVNVGSSSCSCSGYSYGSWDSPSYGQVAGGVCILPDEPTSTHTHTGEKEAGGTWTATLACGKFSGISACSETSGSEWEVTTEEIVNDYNSLYAHKYPYHCWCKMTSPTTSLWVSTGMFIVNIFSCAQECALACGGGALEHIINSIN